MTRTRLILVGLVLVGLALFAAVAPAEIVVTGESAMPRVTVKARNVVPLELLGQIARETRRVLLLPDDLPTDDALSGVDLRDRPLDEVVEIIAGTAGLVSRVGRDSITITTEPVAPGASDLRMRALAADAWALLTHPGRPEVLDTRVAMARLYAQLDQIESAVGELTRAWSQLEKSPLDMSDARTASLLETIPRLLGENHARLENWPRVIRHLGRLSLDEDCEPRVLLLLGRAYAEIDEPRSAREHLSRLIATASSPYHLEARFRLGLLDLAAGDHPGARRHLETATRSPDPEVAGTALLTLADMASKRGRDDVRAELLAAFGERFPKDDRAPMTALLLVDCVAGPLENPLRAADLLEEVLETYPDCMTSVEAAMRVARLWAKAECTSKAVARLEGELETRAEDDPARAGLLEELARILEDDLMPESAARARVVYRHLAVIPGHRQAAKLRAARCLLRLAEQAPTLGEQRRELLACLAEVVAISPDDLTEEDRAMRLDVEVECHERLGDPEAARKAQEDSLR